MNLDAIRQTLSVIFKGYKLYPFRVFLVALALVCACAGLTSVYVLNETAKTSYANQSQPLLNGVGRAIIAKNGEQISVEDYAALRRAGANKIVAVAQYRLEHSSDQIIEVLGLDLYAMMSLTSLLSEPDAQQISQLSFNNSSRYFIHPDHLATLTREGVVKNNELIIDKDGSFPFSFSLTPYAGTGMGNQLIGDIETVFDDFPLSTISYLLVVGEMRIKEDALPEHLFVRELNTGINAKELTQSFHLNLLAMGLLMFVVCVFVMMNALHLMMMKRIINFKILRQLGISRLTIICACLIELIGIALIASFVGTLLGLELSSLLSPAVNQTLQGLYGVYVGHSNISLLQLFVNALAACLIGGLVAIILPLRLLNQRIAIAVTDSSSVPSNYLWLGGSLVCLGLTGLLLWFTDGLVSAFIMIACLLFAGCFSLLYLLPILIKWVSNITPVQYPLLKWSNSDALRISRKSSIAFCAFFLAVAANIGMNLMVNSFRVATESWITQRLNAEAYIYTNQTDDVISWLHANYPQIDINVRQAEQGKFHQQSLQIRSYPQDSADQLAMQFDKASQHVWQLFAQGKGILISQQLAFANNLSLGQSIQIERHSGHKVNYIIAGIYLDYGNTQPQVLLPEDAFEKSRQGRKILSLNKVPGSSASISALVSDFPTTFEQTQIIITEDLLKLSMQTFDKTFVITNGLNFITLLVAGFSLATSILVIDIDNSPQRALLRSMGVSSLALFKLSLVQLTLLSMFIMVIAAPFGFFLSWLLINVVNLQAFYWVYPLIVDPLKLSIVFVMSLAVLLATTAIPAAINAKRRPIEDLLCLND